MGDEELIHQLADAGYTPAQIEKYLADRDHPPVAQQAADAARTVVGGAASVAGAHPYLAGVLGVGAVIKGGSHAAEAATRSVRANRRLAQLTSESGGVDALRAKIAEYQNTGRGDLPTLADLSDAARRQADFTATSNPETRDVIAKIHQQRQLGAAGRIKQDVVALSPAGAGGEPAARTEIANSEQAQADWAKSPDGFEGLRQANPIIKDPLSFSQMLEQKGNEPLRAAYGKVRAQSLLVGGNGAPSFDTMHQMARDLNKQITAAFKDGDGETAKQLKAARARLYDQMEVQVGDKYKQVTRQYRAFSQQQELLDEGLKFWNQPMQVKDVQEMVKTMTPEELNIFRRGVASGLLTQLDVAHSNPANDLLKGELTQSKLEVVFGSKATLDRFLTGRVALESEMALAGGIGKGAQTAGRASEIASEAGPASAEAVAHFVHNPVGAVVRGTLGRLLPSAATRARGTAKALAPMFEAQGAEALLELLKKLPK